MEASTAQTPAHDNNIGRHRPSDLRVRSDGDETAILCAFGRLPGILLDFICIMKPFLSKLKSKMKNE
jgi:hypothetical protein